MRPAWLLGFLLTRIFLDARLLVRVFNRNYRKNRAHFVIGSDYPRIHPRFRHFRAVEPPASPRAPRNIAKMVVTFRVTVATRRARDDREGRALGSFDAGRSIQGVTRVGQRG